AEQLGADAERPFLVRLQALFALDVLRVIRAADLEVGRSATTRERCLLARRWERCARSTIRREDLAGTPCRNGSRPGLVANAILIHLGSHQAPGPDAGHIAGAEDLGLGVQRNGVGRNV